MMVRIKFRIKHAAVPFFDGFLLPDETHVIHVFDCTAFLYAVVPDEPDGFFNAVSDGTIVALDVEDTTLAVERIYRRLLEISAYELLTKCWNEEFEAYTIPSDER